MATTEDIAELRRLINEPDNVAPWTDLVLDARIEADPDLVALASAIWREKAATYAGLVDVKEGNSDRKLSQLYKNALEMSTSLGVSATATVSAGRRTTTRRIERQ